MRQFDINVDDISGSASSIEPHPQILGPVEDDLCNLMRKVGETEYRLSQNSQLADSTMRKTLLSLLTVSDSFENVFTAVQEKQDLVTPQMKKWLGNFRTTYRLLRRALEDEGVTRIENLDAGFDPHWHTVAGTVTDPSKPDGTILKEVCAGYLWRKTILRKAEVVVTVSARPESAAGGDIVDGCKQEQGE